MHFLRTIENWTIRTLLLRTNTCKLLFSNFWSFTDVYKHNWEQIQVYAICSENISAMSNTISVIVYLLHLFHPSVNSCTVFFYTTSVTSYFLWSTVQLNWISHRYLISSSFCTWNSLVSVHKIVFNKLFYLKAWKVFTSAKPVSMVANLKNFQASYFINQLSKDICRTRAPSRYILRFYNSVVTKKPPPTFDGRYCGSEFFAWDSWIDIAEKILFK